MKNRVVVMALLVVLSVQAPKETRERRSIVGCLSPLDRHTVCCSSSQSNPCDECELKRTYKHACARIRLLEIQLGQIAALGMKVPYQEWQLYAEEKQSLYRLEAAIEQIKATRKPMKTEKKLLEYKIFRIARQIQAAKLEANKRGLLVTPRLESMIAYKKQLQKKLFALTNECVNMSPPGGSPRFPNRYIST